MWRRQTHGARTFLNTGGLEKTTQDVVSGRGKSCDASATSAGVVGAAVAGAVSQYDNGTRGSLPHVPHNNIGLGAATTPKAYRTAPAPTTVVLFAATAPVARHIAPPTAMTALVQWS